MWRIQDGAKTFANSGKAGGGDHGENSHVFSIAAYKCKYCICVSKYVLLRDLLLICLLFTENV